MSNAPIEKREQLTPEQRAERIDKALDELAGWGKSFVEAEKAGQEVVAEIGAEVKQGLSVIWDVLTDERPDKDVFASLKDRLLGRGPK